MIRQMLADPTRRCLAVQKLPEYMVIGSTGLYELDLAEGRAEVGSDECFGIPELPDFSAHPRVGVEQLPLCRVQQVLRDEAPACDFP